MTDEEEEILQEILEQINAELDKIIALQENEYQNKNERQHKMTKLVYPVKINFKKINITGAKVEPKEPTRATSGAAGFDMTAVDFEKVRTFDGEHGILADFYRYHTGIALELPPGWTALAFPRSSIVKTGAVLGNSVGVIDSDYRGEITFCFKAEYPPYHPGERIGQLVIIPVPDIVLEEAVELSETARGSGGYGSTGA